MGHALVAVSTGDIDPLHRVTIVPAAPRRSA
jgi:ATP-dependent Zn protease